MFPRSKRSKSRSSSPSFEVHKPNGVLTPRVQAVGPEHFGILSVDCAKKRSKFMLCDFYGEVLIPPTYFPHAHGDFQRIIDQVRQALERHPLRDLVIAIERTGEYHRPVQRAFRAAGWEVRLVHPYVSRRFRQAADPAEKSDDKDLAGIHRATVNGFGLLEADLPDVYQQLQCLIRQRRDLVEKNTILRCQIREYMNSLMPGYAELFDHLWESAVALPIARATGSAQVIRELGLPGLIDVGKTLALSCRITTLATIHAWALDAPSGHPQTSLLRTCLIHLDDDRLQKTKEIRRLDQDIATLLTTTPYILLLSIPGINVVSAADLAGEMGPIEHYANPNRITGRAGLRPARYQSDEVDRPGRLQRCANRRLRAALLQIADHLTHCNDYFLGKTERWHRLAKDPRWIRVKIAKQFSRIAYAILAGRMLVPHLCCQPRSAILDKLIVFHREHATPMNRVLHDLQNATEQLPRPAMAAEALPLREHLEKSKAARGNGPQLLGDIIPIVLARLGVLSLQSKAEDRDPS